MGFFSNLKAQKAYALQSKGHSEEAMALYEQAFADGMDSPRHMLAYSVLLVRNGKYTQAQTVLRKAEKLPGLTAEQKSQLIMNYAACDYKMGHIDKGIRLMEKQHMHHPSGLIYETLGYLYVEKYDHEKTPDFDAMDRENLKNAQEAWEKADAEARSTAEITHNEYVPVPFEAPESSKDTWLQGKEKAAQFLQEALDYDDEDPICLDNMGQFLYRVMDDREGAKPFFDKAIAEKDTQIDTLYFLSRYDLAQGDSKAAMEKLEKALEGRFSPLNYATKEMVTNELSALRGQE